MPRFCLEQIQNALGDLIVDNRADKLLCHRSMRLAEHIQHCSLFHDLPVSHDGNLVADHLDHLHLVGDQQNCHAHLFVDAL